MATTLYVYITGVDGAGKSTLLRTLGEPVQQGDGLEYADFVIDNGLEVRVFCADDGQRFDHLLQVPTRDLLGYIVVVDSTDADSWSMARVMMANCRGHALLPTLIAANKQDLPHAADPSQLSAWFGGANATAVSGLVATDPQLARAVFLELLMMVKSEMDQLDALIEKIEAMIQNGEL
jgi:signal recognition particle receptor subunit beta